MNKIIEGLREAIAHARGDHTAARTQKVWSLSGVLGYIYPKPVQTDVILRLFRLAAEQDRHHGPIGKLAIIDMRDGHEISGDILDEDHAAVLETHE